MSLVFDVDRPISYLYLMNILSNCQKATLTSEKKYDPLSEVQ